MSEIWEKMVRFFSLNRVGNYAVAAGGAICALFGGFDMPVRALIVLVVLDYATGIMAAWVEKRVSSAVGFRGIVKKIVILAVVALSVMLDGVMGQTGALRNSTVFFYIANETVSILENVSRSGVPVPAGIRSVLAQLNADETAQKAADEEETNENM